MQNYETLDQLDVQNQYAESMSVEEAFAFGVEWAMYREKLRMGADVRDFSNADKLEDMAQRSAKYAQDNSTSTNNCFWIYASANSSEELDSGPI